MEAASITYELIARSLEEFSCRERCARPLEAPQCHRDAGP